MKDHRRHCLLSNINYSNGDSVYFDILASSLTMNECKVKFFGVNQDHVQLAAEIVHSEQYFADLRMCNKQNYKNLEGFLAKTKK